jgi:hypothetical protein
MKYLIFVSALLFLACQSILGPNIELDEPFELGFNESKILDDDDLRVEFSQLLEDSRCPTDVQCPWEGRARIGLFLQTPADSHQVTLSISGYATLTDTLAHQPVDTLGYRFTLLQLDPYPVSDQQPQNSDYIAILKISRLVR